jgi:hypothetical protein
MLDVAARCQTALCVNHVVFRGNTMFFVKITMIIGVSKAEPSELNELF